MGAFIWGIFWLTLFALFSMLGIKWIKWVTRITSYIPLIAIIIACILFVVFAPNALTNFSKAWNVDANALIKCCIRGWLHKARIFMVSHDSIICYPPMGMDRI